MARAKNMINQLRKELDEMPMAMAFEAEDGNVEICNSTGYAIVCEDDDGEWNEFVDSFGCLHYGR